MLNGLTGSLKGHNFDAGKDFDVVAISFDARENDKPDLAKNKKANYIERYGRPGHGKRLAFPDRRRRTSIEAVTKAAGFKYQWDEKTQQFAHAGGRDGRRRPRARCRGIFTASTTRRRT